MTLGELLDALVKGAPVALVGGIQWLTGLLPSLLLWVAFIYNALLLYVFIRDKLRRRKQPADDSEIQPQARSSADAENPHHRKG